MSSGSRRFSIVSLLVLILLGFGGWSQRYDIYDWWQLRNYDPPAEIAQLADDIQLTDYGQRLFYVAHPELDEEIAFRQNCTVTEASIVLGCYTSGKRIFLFEVSDKRLEGVHQVTAAHEMLHAAYQRLDDGERSRIDTLTAAAFKSLNDARIEKAIENYKKRDPSVVPNELHSILATEVKKLPAELDNYYKQYFEDRQVIVKFSQDYEDAFEDLRDQVAAYDQQLSSLKAQISAEEASLKAQQSQLQSQRQQMDAQLAAGQTSEYNAQVPSYNSRVNAYNASVNRIRQLIDQYNSLVKKRNAVALEENELLEAIDSRPDTIQAR